MPAKSDIFYESSWFFPLPRIPIPGYFQNVSMRGSSVTNKAWICVLPHGVTKRKTFTMMDFLVRDMWETGHRHTSYITAALMVWMLNMITEQYLHSTRNFVIHLHTKAGCLTRDPSRSWSIDCPRTQWSWMWDRYYCWNGPHWLHRTRGLRDSTCDISGQAWVLHLSRLSCRRPWSSEDVFIPCVWSLSSLLRLFSCSDKRLGWWYRGGGTVGMPMANKSNDRFCICTYHITFGHNFSLHHIHDA